MARFRPLKKYGDSIVIRVNSQDLLDLGWEIGDDIDISECNKREIEADEAI